VKHGCVILADVHHPMLEATKGLLEVIFDTIVMVSSFESLLEAAQKIRPTLIVVDLSLPSSDGHKLLLKLDERLNKFKIIILGTYSEADIVNTIMKKGVKGYVLKQSTATDLLQAVDKVLGGETYVSPLVVAE
jgi:DNA-binding NarL/FixJ family response regulator